jgi:hypothetical protein
VQCAGPRHRGDELPRRAAHHPPPPRAGAEDLGRNTGPAAQLADLAAARRRAPAQPAVAWPRLQGAAPITGATRFEHLTANADADAGPVTLTLAEAEPLCIGNPPRSGASPVSVSRRPGRPPSNRPDAPGPQDVRDVPRNGRSGTSGTGLPVK